MLAPAVGFSFLRGRDSAVRYPCGMAPTVTLTRQQLYDLVWSKPMTTIAAEFGVSSVAFAKNCTRLDVPRPGRGYWQQLASGLNPEREPLPSAAPATPASITLTKHEQFPGISRDAPLPPVVQVPGQVRNLHPVVKEMAELLASERHSPMLIIPGHERSLLRVSVAGKPRALRILHALLTAFDGRGHQCRLQKGCSKYALEVVVGGSPVGLTLHERSNLVESTGAARAWRQHDAVPSGRLALAVGGPYSSFRWSDRKRHSLEDALGEVVLDVEASAVHQVEAGKRYAAEQAIRQREQRRIQDGERRVAHRLALADDLATMAAAWSEAERLKAFLDAASHAVPLAAQTQEFTAWLTWGRAHAAALDPLSRGERVAKPLEPQALNLAEEESLGDEARP